MSASWRPESTEVEAILGDIRSQPGVMCALLVSPDGLLLAGQVGDEAEEMWGAVTAVLANLGDQLARAEQAGGLQTAVFFTAACRLVVQRVKLGSLVAAAAPEAKLEQVAAELARAAQRLEAGENRPAERGSGYV